MIREVQNLEKPGFWKFIIGLSKLEVCHTISPPGIYFNVICS